MAQEFDTALNGVLTDASSTAEQRRSALVNWADLPQARFAQPREDHLLPLHVVRRQLRLIVVHHLLSCRGALASRTNCPF